MPTEGNDFDLGKNLRLRRSEKKLSLERLAHKSGISLSYLSLMERNKVDPSFSKITAYCDAIGIPITKLVVSDQEQNSLLEMELFKNIKLLTEEEQKTLLFLVKRLIK